MPLARNQTTSPVVTTPMRCRPCTKLLMVKGRMNAMPVIASAKKSRSLFAAKKLKPRREAASLRQKAVTSALQDRGDALPPGGADRDQAASRAALGERLRERGDDPRAGGGERVPYPQDRAVGV